MPRFFRRRSRQRAGDERRHDDAAQAGDDDNVDLAGADNTWWSEHEVSRPWEPTFASPGPGPDPGPDPLDVHLGDAWRQGPGSETPHDPEPDGTGGDPSNERAEYVPDLEATNPYAVLGVRPGAPWEEILAAHRALARRYHPDKVANFDEVTRGHAEDIMFKVNAAYRDLKIRRGR